MRWRNISIQWSFYEKLYWSYWWRMFIWSWLSISCKFIYLHNDLLFLPERMKTGKIEKRVVNMHDKKQYVKQGWIVLIMHSHIFFVKSKLLVFSESADSKEQNKPRLQFFWPCVLFKDQKIWVLKITKIWISKK